MIHSDLKDSLWFINHLTFSILHKMSEQAQPQHYVAQNKGHGSRISTR